VNDKDRIEKKDPDEDKVLKVQAAHREARKHQRQWRVEAMESYEFEAGRQWSEDDKATLENEGRPIVTFNRMSPYFDSIAGTEINNRQEIKYLPRTIDDGRQTDILTAAVKWACDRTNAGDEESDAFRDMLITGIGWIETRMEYDEDPDGKICIEWIDPLEMLYDPASRKRNLQDRNWHQRIKWLSKDEIQDRWPDVDIGASANPWGDEGDDKPEPHNANLAFLYRPNSTDGYDKETGKYRVVQHQYWVWETVYRVQDPATGKLVTLTADKFKLAEQQIPGLKAAKIRRKAYKYMFVVGDKIAEEGDLKCGFTMLCMTGKRDHNTGLFYGLTRVMKDPQRWANKFLSQIMHIVNSNAKGGLMAEAGAFVDPKRAEEDWSDPNAIVWMKNGAISGNKIKERVSASYPQGLDKLLQFAIASIPDATGINLEFMGMQDRAQANVLEQTRKKAAFVILAGFFDSLRLYRKEEGRLLAHFIKEYMNDGRIIRITTENGQQPIPLQLTEDAMMYDVVVDQAPDSPNMKEEVWGALKEIIPSALKAGMPVPPSVWKFSPLPTETAMEFTNSMQGKLPPKAQEAMQGMQQQIQKLGQENQQLKQQAQIKMMQDQTKKQIGMTKNMIEAEKVKRSGGNPAGDAEFEAEKMRAQEQMDERAEMRALQAEMAKMNAEHAREMRLAREQQAHEAEMQRKELTAQILQAQVAAAKDEAKAAKETKVDNNAVKGDVAKISKIVNQQSQDIATLTKLVTNIAQSVQEMANEPEDEPSEYRVIRDKSGKIESIKEVH
jgi:hypothetical protein